MEIISDLNNNSQGAMRQVSKPRKDRTTKGKGWLWDEILLSHWAHIQILQYVYSVCMS